MTEITDLSPKPRVRVSARGWMRPAQHSRGAVIKNSADYIAAGHGPRSVSWDNAKLVGPQTLLGKSLDTIRNRVRYQVRNDAIASRVLDFAVGKVVGGGIYPSLKPGLEDPVFDRLKRDFFDQCDADGVVDFFGIQEIVARDTMTGGDTFVRFRARDPKLDTHLSVPLQLQVLPGEMVPSVDFLNESVSGVVRNGIGRIIKYKFFKKHPGERIGPDALAADGTYSFVPAEDVAHVFWKREPGQVRGEPWLTRGLVTLHDLDAYQDAELVAKKMSAMPVFFVETPVNTATPSGPASVSDGTDGNPEGTPLDADGNVWVPEDPIELMPELAPGAVVPVAPGYKVNPALPKDVGQNYDVFVRRQLQRVCASIGAPYELITGDTPPGANERMMRIRISDFFSLVRIWRRMMIRQFCDPAWRAFVMAAFHSGKWTPKAGTTIEDYLQVEWRGEPMQVVNPFQENQADLLAVRAGFKTLSQVIREGGGDPDLVLAERAAELKKTQSLGLMLDSDPKFTSRSGTSQAKAAKSGFVIPDESGDGDPDEFIDL